MERPKPELWPCALSRIGVGLATLMPRMTDRAMVKMLPRRMRENSAKAMEEEAGSPRPSESVKRETPQGVSVPPR
jgi:hypothetical protein